jgi:hypothetical protein
LSVVLFVIIAIGWILTGNYTSIFDAVWDNFVEPICDLGAWFLGLGR